MAKIGVILSGCGVMDGSEIHEAVSAMIHLDQAGAAYQCMAPDKPQRDVVNHLAGKPEAGATRNVLVEAARIARGKIVDLATVKGTDYDGFILPGGFGAAKNLCDFAVAGDACRVDEQVARVLREAHAARKVIGLICISPVIGAALFGKSHQAKVTVGAAGQASEAVTAMGGRHEVCPVDQFIVDEKNRIITTPAYMYNASISQVFGGIGKMVARLLEMAGR